MRAENRISRARLVAVAIAVLLLALVAATFMYESDNAESLQAESAARLAALASEHSPTLGDPGAKVHIVEFLERACETCALFYPMVKQCVSVGLNMEQLMADINAMEVLLRIEQDKKDSIALRVSATPEYSVNGRQLPNFGRQHLADLVREELSK